MIINFLIFPYQTNIFLQAKSKGPNKCKHEISDSLHYSILFILFCYTKLCTDPHVNKDFYLLRVKVGAPLSADVKFLLNQRKEAKFVTVSFLLASIMVHSKSKQVCKGDCQPKYLQEYCSISLFYLYGDSRQDFD